MKNDPNIDKFKIISGIFYSFIGQTSSILNLLHDIFQPQKPKFIDDSLLKIFISVKQTLCLLNVCFVCYLRVQKINK